ncbi:MAG: SixA phosphatase family protein [Lacipirellulaceae bacterium]
MRLYVARHAWAGEFGDPAWPDDSLRELTSDGIVRYRRVVERLAAAGVAPVRIATSPYARCRQTAELLSAGLPERPPIDVLHALAPGSDLATLTAWTKGRAAEGDLCWVGHNPDLERMVAALVGAPGGVVRFAKGAVSCLRFDHTPTGRFDGVTAGVLEWHATAKLLGV